MQMQITTTVEQPLTVVVSEEAKRLAGAAALGAAVAVLGTILVPVLAIVAAVAWPFLPLFAARADRRA